MRTKVIRNYFEDYNKLEEFKQEFLKELEEWKEEMMLEHNLHHTVFEEILLQDVEPTYTLQYEFHLQGRYKYHLTYAEIKEHSLQEKKTIPVKVFVTKEEFKKLIIQYMVEYPDICPEKNKLVVNGVTFKLYIEEVANDKTI
jgi:hypothetical protein